MLSDLKRIWAIFIPAERRKAVWMLLLMVLMAGAEILGVLSIMPFLSVLSRPAVIHENFLLSAAYERFGFRDAREFTLALGFASITLVMASSAFKMVTLHVLNRFVHLLRHTISSRLLSRYLHQPYEFFLARNPSALGKNVLSEVDQLMFQLVQPLSQLTAQGCVVLAMAVLIFLYDPLTATCIVTVLGLLYGVIYGFVRKRLGLIGHERTAANGRRYKACNEALGGIKTGHVEGNNEHAVMLDIEGKAYVTVPVPEPLTYNVLANGGLAINEQREFSIAPGGVLTAMIGDGQVTDAKISALNVNKLVQTDGDELILNGGTANA